MSARLSRPPALGPLEAYAMQFGHFSPDAGQAVGLSQPSVPSAAATRTIPEILTALVQAQCAELQRLQVFLCKAVWNAEAVNALGAAGT